MELNLPLRFACHGTPQQNKALFPLRKVFEIVPARRTAGITPLLRRMEEPQAAGRSGPRKKYGPSGQAAQTRLGTPGNKLGIHGQLLPRWGKL